MASDEDRTAEPPSSPWGFRFLALVVVGGAAALILRGQLSSFPNSGASHPLVGKPMLLDELTSVSEGGQSLGQADLDGRVTLINFWGTWCPPCRIEMPHLVELEQDLRDRGPFQMVSVSCGQGVDQGALDGLREETLAFMKHQSIEFPVYLDPAARTRLRLMDQLGEPSFSYPTTILVGRDAKILGMWQSYREGLEDEIRQAIESALQDA